jgi:NADH-quinone oxidoreductase subunit J
MNVLFLLAAGAAVVSTFVAITRSNVLHAILYLIVSFASIAVIFYLLGAPFIAALEIITYAGAIMVLFLFAVMLLNLGGGAIDQERRWQPLAAWIGPAIAGLLILGELLHILMRHWPVGKSGTIVPSVEVGRLLFLRYFIGVELAAMLLLAALLGAGRLGHRSRITPEQRGSGHDADSL